jgi:hypothetical protein
MTGDRRFGVTLVRKAVRESVRKRSLRAVADEIGMSSSGLHSFLRGGKPHPKTLQSLMTWHAAGRRALVSDAARVDLSAASLLVAAHVRAATGTAARQRLIRRFARDLAEQLDTRSLGELERALLLATQDR